MVDVRAAAVLLSRAQVAAEFMQESRSDLVWPAAIYACPGQFAGSEHKTNICRKEAVPGDLGLTKEVFSGT